jgi:hypothetical protein
MNPIAYKRLYHQGISHQKFRTPAEVVAGLGAMQAQDYPGAKWSIGLRLHGSTDADIEQALADKKIVRTWVMRGTLHFVAAEDVRWLVALTAPRTNAVRLSRYRELELDEQTLARSTDILAKALEKGEQRTRKQLFAVLQENGISTEGQRGVHMLQKASLDGLICQSVERQRDPVFMALDGSLAQGKTLAREEAIVELARCYFLTRGPATLQDFVWWSSLTVSDARMGLEAVKPQLVEETIEGQSCWIAENTPMLKMRSPAVYLLPGFDEYLLSYRDRSAVLDPAFAQRVVPGGNGIFISTVVIDGQIVGLWKRAVKKGAVNISVHPFENPLTDVEQAALAEFAQRYGAFVGMPVSL